MVFVGDYVDFFLGSPTTCVDHFCVVTHLLGCFEIDCRQFHHDIDHEGKINVVEFTLKLDISRWIFILRINIGRKRCIKNCTA